MSFLNVESVGGYHKYNGGIARTSLPVSFGFWFLVLSPRVRREMENIAGTRKLPLESTMVGNEEINYLFHLLLLIFNTWIHLYFILVPSGIHIETTPKFKIGSFS